MTDPLEYFIATHVAEAHGPQYELRDHLLKQRAAFAYVACPFDYAKIPTAELVIAHRGEVTARFPGHPNRSRGVVSWVRDAWFVWRSAWRHSSRNTVFIGINCLHATLGIWLRRLGRCRRVVYYVIDYTPQRFPSPWINAVYQAAARFAARHADKVWNLSERMAAVHRGFGTRPERSALVPIGLDQEALQVADEDAIERQRWVMVSTLFESKGVQQAIRGLALVPAARLTVIGTGPYRETLERLAQDLGVAERVEFLGLVGRKELYRRLAESRVALAPYQADPANYSYYADPAKPKEYLGCGVPVVITRVPWIAEVIESRPMGLAIEDRAEALAQACERLMSDDAFWRTCRQNALAFTRDLAWDQIFQRALADLTTPAAKG